MENTIIETNGPFCLANSIIEVQQDPQAVGKIKNTILTGD
jgi:hypothetical protein